MNYYGVGVKFGGTQEMLSRKGLLVYGIPKRRKAQLL